MKLENQIETPPAEGSTHSALVESKRHEQPVTGGRAPMIIALVVIATMVIAVLVYVAAGIFAYGDGGVGG